MRISSRTKSMAFFITLGVCLVALTFVVNVGWIVINWRRLAPLIFGVIFFGLIIAGLSVNTVFLVREIRRNEQQDSFLNAVTHELKTPIASIRMYLETLQSRQLDEPQRREFYRIMLEDTDRLLGTVEQVLKAGEARQRSNRKNWQELDFSELVKSAFAAPSGTGTFALRRRTKGRAAGAWESGGVAHGGIQSVRQCGEVFPGEPGNCGGCAHAGHGYGFVVGA
jgi:hypothetical protein